MTTRDAQDAIADVIASLARAGVDLRQRPDGEWEVSKIGCAHRWVWTLGKFHCQRCPATRGFRSR